MNLIEAMKFSESENKEIMSDIAGERSVKYAIHRGILMSSEHNLGSWDTSIVTIEMILADWQEWQEPREYVGYWEAMVSILTDKKIYKHKCDALDRLFYEKDGNVVYDRDGYKSVAFIPGPGCMGDEWYIITPAPEPEIDSADESHEPDKFAECIGCGIDLMKEPCICKDREPSSTLRIAKLRISLQSQAILLYRHKPWLPENTGT